MNNSGSSRNLSDDQRQVVERPLEGAVFLEGPFGSGKTTVGITRLEAMLEHGIRSDTILIVVPQRTLATPYHLALHQSESAIGAQVQVITFGGLARRMVDLFWPMISEEAGFTEPDRPPRFLTLETAQYYMARVVQPLLEAKHFFDSIAISRNRLYGQILDNLNKSAVVGFPYTEIGDRLKMAWIGDPAQALIYDQAQECAVRFRQECLQHNLLDFSLQMDVFREHLWPAPMFQEYLKDRFRHLLYDNLEEDTPIAHDMIAEWLPHLESVLLIFDTLGGYRRFLGADPQYALQLKELCHEQFELHEAYVTSKELQVFGGRLAITTSHRAGVALEDFREALRFEYHRYQPQMLEWVADQILGIVQGGDVPLGEIAVLAPYMTDALRFSLSDYLLQRGVPVRSHRPSRALREESAAQCLLTLASLAHPRWESEPLTFDIAFALVAAIEGLDLVRAHLLANILYRTRDSIKVLEPFEQLNAAMQERITSDFGERYERLRKWLEEYRSGEVVELDIFMNRLFGEVLSQWGFGFHRAIDAGSVAANLIESVQKFRWVVGSEHSSEGFSIGREYTRLVQEGLVASQYIRSWELDVQEAVLLAPAYTFLMTNRSVDIQFWLDVGGRGWWERLYQPLTHPYVLSRSWRVGDSWSDVDEFRTRQVALETLTQGLIRRCRKRIYLGMSELGESGYEQRGPLLRAIQKALIDLPPGMMENSD
jgi:superfamily I DNA/RNA helicase